MERQDNDEDKTEKAEETMKTGEIPKCCDPIVKLDRISLPKNGLVYVSKKLQSEKDDSVLSSDKAIIEGDMFQSDKPETEDNSNDTAETIKKIKEFIAMGRCEESRKEKQKKPKPILKRKVQDGNYHKIPTKKVVLHKTVSVDVEADLERTLEGFADSENSNEGESKPLADRSNVAEVDKDASLDKNIHDINTKKNSEGLDTSELTTPSRTSKRIQSKTVKFSAKKMLRGDDAGVLRRMIPGYENETPQKKERVIEKKTKSEVKKVLPPSKEQCPPEKVMESEEEPKDVVMDENDKEHEKTPEPNDDTIPRSVSPVAPSSVEMLFENKEKITALSDQIGKFSVSSGKITVELGGAQQKKVVRIAMPPQPPRTPSNSSLGPDIIIKRVKPVKKTVLVPEIGKVPSKNTTGKDLSDSFSNLGSIKAKKFSQLNERMNSPKLKEEIERFKKSICRPSKIFKKPDIKDLNMKQLSEKIIESNNLIGKNTNIERTREDVIPDGDHSNEEDKPLSQRLSEVLEQTAILIDQEDKKKQMYTQKAKKKNRVTFAEQTKSRSKNPKKSSRRSPSPEEDISDDEPPRPESLFDRFFSEEEILVEIGDLESSSSDDLEDRMYSHYINLKKPNEPKEKEKKKEDEQTMYDLMHDISEELPSWNLHLSSDGQVFCLAQIDRKNNVPVMKKVIEIDLEYNAKVFMNGSVLPEYKGNYSNYEDIKQLIYNVNKL